MQTHYADEEEEEVLTT